ncbi:hypothetical protein T06_11386 [Trichinella sp. T6]|nr:hypothetical protein T06_11386 [Trichinella sp. T6]
MFCVDHVFKLLVLHQLVVLTPVGLNDCPLTLLLLLDAVLQCRLFLTDLIHSFIQIFIIIIICRGQVSVKVHWVV